MSKKMVCDLCGDPNSGPEHEFSVNHIKNKILHEYSRNKKQFAGNRKGVLVSCNTKTSLLTLENCTDGKIKISTKPNEQVKFTFVVKNDCKKEDIHLNFIQIGHNKLNFKMSDHGLTFGGDPYVLKPKARLNKDVSVTFQSGDIGQYEVPIIFFFRKPAAEENILIMRDMVVFVEEKRTPHEKVDSPYAQKEVTAEQLIKSTMSDRGDDMFRMKKEFRTMFAGALKVREDASDEDKALCNKIKEIFAIGVNKENYTDFFHHLLWYEETIAGINLKKYNMTNVPLEFTKNNSYALQVPGLSEKRPSLMIGDHIHVKPHGIDKIMFAAEISDITDHNIVIIKGLDPLFTKYYKPEGSFDVRFFMSRLPLERMHQAVARAGAGSLDQRRVFPIENFLVVSVKPAAKYFNPLIEGNPEQRKAVEHIVANSSGLAPYLLHGPPGTGKTVTVVEAILQLVHEDPSARILVCTDSNTAADHVASQIIKYLPELERGKQMLLRANSKFRVWETLPEVLKPYSNGWSRNTFELIKIDGFRSYNIVVTTLSHAAKFAKELHVKRMERPIKHLFIDEAAQASEPAALIPTCGLLAYTGQLVLAGDPHQLGPVVISHRARGHGLGLSLMERLKRDCDLYSEERNDPKYTMMLRNNFRSDAAILQIPNEVFYKSQLRVCAIEDPLSKVDILGERQQSHAVVFHGVLSKEQRMGKSPSYFNNMEMEIVKMYINYLIKRHRVTPDDIGVVTPYIRQAYKIKAWLVEQAFPGVVEVGTVEAFQGKEKRVIIISTVRANCQLLSNDAKFQLGFLVDSKRFNVALTRAKAKAIIIGNPLCLEKDPKWRAYIQQCRGLGTYFGYDAQIDNVEQADQEIVDRLRLLLKEFKIK